MELVLLMGIQAAGKTTFCQRYMAGSHVRVNLDTLKRRPREERLVQECIANRQPFVVDNTNVLASDRARYIPLANAAGYRIKGYVFDSPVDVAVGRNARRQGRACVPSFVIHATHAKYEPPSWNEGFDELYRVTAADGEFVVKRMRRQRRPPTPFADTATWASSPARTAAP